MPENKSIIIFGAGIIGRRALNFYGAERVYCFADNYKSRKCFCEKEVISFEELVKIHNDYNVIIAVNFTIASQIEKQCCDNGIPAKKWEDIVSYKDYKIQPEIAAFKDRHRNKRCFLIGNGPSLRKEDLDKLSASHDVTFACNAINKIFPQTKWRPDYYFACDMAFIKNNIVSIAETDAKEKFIMALDYYLDDDEAIKAENVLRDGNGEVFYFQKAPISSLDQKVQFSDDPSRAMFVHGTVMTCMMQMAVYMGFTSLYLIGVDNTTGVINKDVEKYLSQKRHFYEEGRKDINKLLDTHHEYFNEENSNNRINDGYKWAEAYSKVHDFRIYNATRGGKLETFERVDFDNLFE